MWDVVPRMSVTQAVALLQPARAAPAFAAEVMVIVAVLGLRVLPRVAVASDRGEAARAEDRAIVVAAVEERDRVTTVAGNGRDADGGRETGSRRS
jgi:hypothetical protein